MDQSVINRLLIENIADRYIPKIQFDPHRSIRKLVDLGECLSHGKTQKRIFQSAQKLFEKDSSPYYTVIQRVISQFDARAIKTFGMNLGLNSWFALAERKSRESAPPWALLFQLDNSPDALPLDGLIELIRQSAEAGIHTFLLWLDQSYEAIDALMARLQTFADCAFALFTPTSLLNADALAQASQANNLLLSLQDTPRDNPEPTVQALRSLRRPFALHTVYSTPGETENILCGKWLERVNRLRSPFAFFFPSPECPAENRLAVRDYARALRTSPRQPVFSMSLYDDVADVDRLITGHTRLLRVRPDGTVLSSAGSPAESAAAPVSLFDLLAQYTTPLASI